MDSQIVHILCEQCRALNRMPMHKLHDQPKCGKCQHALTPLHPAALDDQSLPTILGKAQQPILVDFWATWCGPCRTMAPYFAQAASARPDIHFVKVDVDAAPQLATRFQIRSVPTLMLWQQGRELNRLSGVLSASDLLRWIDQSLS